MDCLSRLIQFQDFLKLTFSNPKKYPPNFLTKTFDKIRKTYSDNELQKFKTLLQPIICQINSPELINCVLALSKFTSFPSWFEVFQPFLLDGDLTFKNENIKRYRKIGISDDFIFQVLFYRSGRPKVNIVSYQKAISVNPKIYPPEFLNYVVPAVTSPELSYLCDAPEGLHQRVLVPVVRYQTGMHGYLTVPSEEEKTWCGTFYYFEPDSPFLLFAPRILITWNKISACLDLGLSFEEVLEPLYQEMTARKDLDEDDQPIDIYPNNIGYSVPGKTRREQWIEVVKGYQNQNSSLIDPLKHIPFLYAAEDIYDQILCQAAIKQGIDVIILKYMTGETRVVSEVLDSRDRKTSFEDVLIPPLLKI